MSCDCVPHPPVFDLAPPPDPSLIWHLISDKPYKKAEECEWNPFVSISDISSNGTLSHPLAPKSLILAASIAFMIMLIIIIAFVYRLKRRGRSSNKTKTVSSDAIMAAGDNVWTYNSMKTSHNGSMGVLMYGGTHSGSRMFQQATPATMRSYLSQAPLEVAPARPPPSATLRLHPNETSAAYHTVGRQYSTSNEYYEEIPPRGTLPSTVRIPMVTPPMNLNGRMSIRKPPPSCRPPPPPQEFRIPPPPQYSPGGSDCSLEMEKELNRIPSDSPPTPWEVAESRSRHSAEGRESGYGTAPSRQWRSPPGSGTRSDDNVPYPLSQAQIAQNMTYV